MGSETKRIVRIVSTDILGELNTGRAIMRIKGIRFMFARAICILTGIDFKRPIGQLSDEEIKILESSIKDPKLPEWMLNRRGYSNEKKHVVGVDLDIRNMDDINLLKHVRSYRGIRHELRLPVRGQRTKSTHRKGGGAVRKKKVQPETGGGKEKK